MELQHAARDGSSRSSGPRKDDNVIDTPDRFEDLNEVRSPPPVENPDEAAIYRHRSIEDDVEGEQQRRSADLSKLKLKRVRVHALSTKLYTVGHLVFFSLFGTLARLGLNALTNYPGAPATFGVLWSNFAGTAVLGFLAELAPAINRHLAVESVCDSSNAEAAASSSPLSSSPSPSPSPSLPPPSARKLPPVPLYIGLATGFCGSFTSFSTFMLDAFEAMANSLTAPRYHKNEAGSSSPVSRGVGDDIMALLAVLLLTIAMCASALKMGAHLAVFVARCWPLSPPPPPNSSSAWSRHFRLVLDASAIFLGFGCWLGAVLMAIFPPYGTGLGSWRGDALFALVFAPLGTLLRFGLGLWLNGVFAAFPLGTFAANVIGTAILAMTWDLQHAQPSTGIATGIAACQLLQGVLDGFCGCLTTVSTWMAELNGLRRRHAYVYGATTVSTGLGLLVVIVGPLRWTVGWHEPSCQAG